jgi:hypothetical protein
MMKDFNDMTIEELKLFYETIYGLFIRVIEHDAYMNELYNDNGEMDIFKWLEDKAVF